MAPSAPKMIGMVRGRSLGGKGRGSGASEEVGYRVAQLILIDI